MNNKLYTEDGYINFDRIFQEPSPYIFISGGRCSGKTYGGLRYVVEHNITFAYMRRTQAQIDLASQNETSVFKELNYNYNWNITAKSIKNQYVYKSIDDEEANIVGYGFALSTISNIRGFSGSDIDVCIYDEFIPELHEKTMKNEFDAWMNAYSTINRNRELYGRAPLKMICMGNSNRIDNPIFIGLHLVEKVEKMKRNHVEHLRIPDRGISVFSLDDCPAVQKLENTALGKLSAGTSFNEMAFRNNFSYNTEKIKYPVRYSEYLPFIRIGNILTILVHKSSNEILISSKLFDCKTTYEDSNSGYRSFCTENNKLLMMYYMGRIEFTSNSAAYYFNKVIHWR